MPAMSTGTILMVEPNPGVMIVARNVLTRGGHEVIAVADADACLAVIEARTIDAVLIDARQADPQLLATLRVDRRIPVVVTFQRGKPVRGGLDVDSSPPGSAAADFLEKPFSPERLLRTVERVIDGWADRTPPLRAPPRPTDTVISSQPFERFDEEDFSDTDQTDIFPFAHLIDPRQARRPASVSGGAMRDVRSGLLSERLRMCLEVEGVRPEPEVLSACLRACDAVLEAAAEPIVSSGGGEAAIEGNIPALSIDQVLQLAMAVSQPARCRVAQGSAAIDIFYDKGSVCFARAEGLPDGFLIGQLLVAEGRVTERELMAALNMPSDGSRLGQRLLAEGRVAAPDLSATLKLQTEELVYEVVRWSSGRFMIFAEEPPPAEARLSPQSLAVPHLLLEGMRRLDEWRRMLPAVGGLETVVDRGEAASRAVMRGLTAEDRDVLKYVDGRRTVAELVRHVGRPTFQVYRALHSLASRKLVTVARK